MADLVKLRNKGRADLEVAFLQLRVVKAGETVDVAGVLVDDPVVAHVLLGQPVSDKDDEAVLRARAAPLAEDAWHIAHPTGDPATPARLLAWPKATWDLVTAAAPKEK
jgi:hypothetical protein